MSEITAMVPKRRVWPIEKHDECFKYWLNGYKRSEVSQLSGVPERVVEDWKTKERWLEKKATLRIQAVQAVEDKFSAERIAEEALIAVAKKTGIIRQLRIAAKSDDVMESALDVLKAALGKIKKLDLDSIGTYRDDKGRPVPSPAEASLGALTKQLADLAKVLRPNNDVLAKLTGIDAEQKMLRPAPPVGGTKIQNAFFHVNARPVGIDIGEPIDVEAQDA